MTTKKKTPIKDFFGPNYELSDKEDFTEKAEALIKAESASGWEVEVVSACFDRGPLPSGHISCKGARADLIKYGALCLISTKHNDYLTAVTHPKGFYLYRAMIALGRIKEPK